MAVAGVEDGMLNARAGEGLLIGFGGALVE